MKVVFWHQTHFLWVSCDASGRLDTKHIFYNLFIEKKTIVWRERSIRHQKQFLIFFSF